MLRQSCLSRVHVVHWVETAARILYYRLPVLRYTCFGFFVKPKILSKIRYDTKRRGTRKALAYSLAPHHHHQWLSDILSPPVGRMVHNFLLLITQ